VATLTITMNNVYEPQHQFYPVYTQSSWITHYYLVVLLDNSVAGKTAEQQWADIWSPTATVVARKRYDDLNPIDIKSIINATDSDRITFGFRAEYGNDAVNNPWAAPSSSIFGFIGTVIVDEQISVTVKNNFIGGKIKAQVTNPPTTLSDSPVTITDMTRKTLYMEAVEGANQPMFEYYTRVWNDAEAPSNKSNWEKRDNFDVSQGTFASTASTSRTLSSSEKNYSYVADMKRVCSATFNSGGGSITANGINGTLSLTVPVVELNYVTVTTASWYSSDGIEYTFSRWSKDGVSYYSPFIINEHGTYTAVYTGKPSNTGKNFTYNGDIGDPINITWTDNQDSNVTEYQIWRRVKHNGILGDATLLATVSRGVQSYTDDEYSFTDGYTNDMLSYDVRAYYEPDGTYSDPQWQIAYGEPFASINENSISMQTKADEVPADYSITNYPNPFNPTTTINYQLPENGFVTIKVFDMLGKEVTTLVNGNRTAGYHNVTFDASRLTSGIYIYTINAGKFIQSKKMLLMK
jgi:hypothetical protein